MPKMFFRGRGIGAEIERPENREDCLGDDRGTAGRTDAEDRLPVLQDKGRAHARKWTFSGGDSIRLGAHQTEVVGDTRLGGEIIHMVVQKDSGPRDHHLAPETGVQRGRAGDPVAVGIRGREVGGVSIGFPTEHVGVCGRRCPRRGDWCSTVHPDPT